jgi:gluconate kinase
MTSTAQSSQPSSYVVLLSGTHVTGKESLSVTLSKHLRCPWIKAEPTHSMASFGASSQAKKGYSYNDVFGRIWFAKLQRLGFDTSGGDGGRGGNNDTGSGRCLAVLSCYAMRRPARDAIRNVMLAHTIRPVFVILHITKETLCGRTLGAEEPELAERIMAAKLADIEEPAEDERDVVLVNSLRNVDMLFDVIRDGIGRVLADGGANAPKT